MTPSDRPATRTLRPDAWRAPLAIVPAAIAAAVILALAVTCVLTTSGWIGTTFPGFFVMPNRVVPSVGLSHWTGVQAGGIYQRPVVAVNGLPVATAAQVYERVRVTPPGTAVEYTFATADGVSRRTIPSMVFRVRDYVELFVPYFLNGLLFAAAGVTVWVLTPATPASAAMLAFGSCLGVFGLCGADLYSPQWFYRLYLAAEAFLPASVLHLALVFPENHVRGRRRLVLAVPYGVALVLALAHQWFHFDPPVFSFIRNLCTAYLGAAGLGLIAAVLYDYGTTTSQLVLQRVRVLLIGAILGLGVPALLMVASGLSGGDVPVNTAAFTAFFFPLTLAYAIVKHDLFAIDAMVKRAVSYLALTGAVFAVYALVVGTLNVSLHSTGLLASPLYPLLLSLAVVLLFDPIKARVQLIVDRLYFRRAYDPERVLQAASQALASTPHLADVLEILLGTICREVQVAHAQVYLRDAAGTLTLARSAGAAVPQSITAIARHDPLLTLLAEATRAVSVYDGGAPEDPGGTTGAPDLFAVLRANLLLPLRFRTQLVGLVALGRKQSGRFYTAADLDFLATLSAQSVVSILHAVAYQQIDGLNHELERKVALRTYELAQANTQLLHSLDERERAFVELQRSQEKLLHAEKMATLGRLTAGIAHEISTPLGAALSTLSVVEGLAEEYRAAVGVPGVTLEDHREIATEMAQVAAEAREWTQKAARFVRSIKLYALGREELHEREFSLAEVIDETCQLLAHRLRLCRCTVETEVAPETPSLFGDAGRLGQVITNLLTNAIDASRDAAPAHGEIRITAGPQDGGVVLRVSDNGAGIQPEHLSHIFEELFTTKPPGLGTGLGLSISRTILADCFGATIEVESEPGRGSTFTVRLPRRRPVDEGLGEPAAAVG